MENFKINDQITIACEWKKTRNGFKHEAVLLIDGSEVERVKCNYLNRTWEQYTYQSVIHKLIEKSKVLNDDQKVAIKSYLDGTDGYDGAGVKRDMKGLKLIGAIATLGDVFGKTKSESNNWKKRMLNAGLKNQGLNFPDDWDTLGEDEKSRRLNGAIEQLK